MKTDPDLLRKELEIQKSKLQSQLNFQHHLQLELQEQLHLQNERIQLMNQIKPEDKSNDVQFQNILENHPVSVYVHLCSVHLLYLCFHYVTLSVDGYMFTL